MGGFLEPDLWLPIAAGIGAAKIKAILVAFRRIEAI